MSTAERNTPSAGFHITAASTEAYIAHLYKENDSAPQIFDIPLKKKITVQS